MKLTEKGIIIGACVFLCVVFVIAALNNPHPLFGYDEEWMIGKTAEQIEARYGEFHSVREVEYADGTQGNYGTYVIRLSDVWKDQDRYWLNVYFDEDGIAKNVYIKRGGAGG